MSKKVTLYQVTVKPRTVEVPDSCPSCNEPTEEVIEVNYNDAMIVGSYGDEASEDGTARLEDVQDNEAGEVFYPIEVRCINCEEPIVDAWDPTDGS